jgi:peptidoglycan/LPS O-acetylase OafA/YrhL
LDTGRFIRYILFNIGLSEARIPRGQSLQELIVTNPRAAQTIPSLNGLRAISVSLVVAAHSGFGKIVPGALGVTVFFFLSGYLITTLMLAESDRTGNIAILNFYTRRIFRLGPPLLVTLAIAYGLAYSGLLPGRITLEGLAAQLLYFANYYAIFFDPSAQTTPAGTGVLWSLAVEEHFYIFFPLLMTAFASVALRRRTIGVLLGGTCLAIFAWRIHLAQSPDFFSDRTYLASETRIDSIIYGCLMALLINPLQAPRRTDKMSSTQWTLFSIGIGLLLFSLIYRNPTFRETFRYSLQGIALFPVFYFAIRFHDNAIFRHLNSSWAVRIGTYSYAIYLIHQIAIFAIDQNAPFLHHNPFFIVAATLVISIAYAAAVDKFVDQYFREFRRKYRSAERPSIPMGPIFAMPCQKVPCQSRIARPDQLTDLPDQRLPQRS